MIGKLVCGLVAVVAVVIGLYDYFPSIPFPSIRSTCHRGFLAPHQFLATKSPYVFEDKDETPTAHPSSCQPLLLWIVVRHGTRNPSAKVIQQMTGFLPPLQQEIIDAHEVGTGGLCQDAFEAIKRWTPAPITQADEKKLVSQGEAELRGISRRFLAKFPSLISKPYNNTTYKFKYTKTERTERSAKFFVEELLGGEEASRVHWPEPLSADPVLRFYKGCPKWKKDVDKNPETYLERIRFENSPTFQTMLKKMTLRLGLDKPLTVQAVEIMYMTCAFETAWNPETNSPWCLFDKGDFQIMEYRQDLEYFWVDGYGFELTYKQACPAVTDLLSHLSGKARDPKSTPSIIAYFTHSGTTLKLLARFGLFNDSIPLLHDNFPIQRNRMWRTSQIDKFATNLAFVLYNCSGEYRVGLLFQEERIPIPGCGAKHDGMCTLSDFEAQYQPIVNNCDMSEMCVV